GLQSQRGAALVEFALVVPFLMIIMCATIDFGLAVYTLNNLTAAVREGGRYAGARITAPVTNDSTVRQRVYDYIIGMNNGLTPAATRNLITVDYVAGTGMITVKITGYPYRPVTPLANVINLNPILLNRTAIFRWEQAPDT
ncbi:MAG: TadE/TadG family type IV pilus assembly protein, partial [Gemmatimonadaceae bacterium]